MTTEKLYEIAEAENIFVYSRDTVQPSFAVEVGGVRAVSLRRNLTEREKRSRLAHEIGHHAKGALYNRETPCYTRGQCEYKANKWAVHKLLPFRSLAAALRRGHTEIWQLADRFSVTEDFIQTAIEIYRGEGKIHA